MKRRLPAIADADPSSPLTADDLRRIVEAAVADEVRARVRVTVDTDDE